MNVNDGAIMLGRFVLAVVWLVAGTSKLRNVPATTIAIQAHRLVPTGWARPLTLVLAIVELALGLLLAAHLATRVSAVVSAILLILFTMSILATAAYPRSGSASAGGCGCFGRLESVKQRQIMQIVNPGPAFARNALLLTLAVALALSSN